MNIGKELWRGMVRENAALVLLLGMCPTLGVTGSAINGLGMGLATMVVLMGSNVVISMIKRLIPDKVRIPAYIVVIASFVTVIEMIMAAYTPDLYDALGVFIPLIVVNCIILGRAEAFASKNGVMASLVDGLVMGLGFTLALVMLGSIRELLGNGSVFGARLLPAWTNMLLFIMPPGAFVALAFLLAGFNRMRNWLEARG